MRMAFALRNGSIENWKPLCTTTDQGHLLDTSINCQNRFRSKGGVTKLALANCRCIMQLTYLECQLLCEIIGTIYYTCPL